MILYGYCYYNKKVNAFTAPTFEPYDQKVKVEMVQRAFIMSNETDKMTYGDNELNFVGTFDDKTCTFKIENKPVFLCNFQKLVKEKK